MRTSSCKSELSAASKLTVSLTIGLICLVCLPSLIDSRRLRGHQSPPFSSYHYSPAMAASASASASALATTSATNSANYHQFSKGGHHSVASFPINKHKKPKWAAGFGNSFKAKAHNLSTRLFHDNLNSGQNFFQNHAHYTEQYTRAYKRGGGAVVHQATTIYYEPNRRKNSRKNNKPPARIYRKKVNRTPPPPSQLDTPVQTFNPQAELVQQSEPTEPLTDVAQNLEPAATRAHDARTLTRSKSDIREQSFRSRATNDHESSEEMNRQQSLATEEIEDQSRSDRNYSGLSGAVPDEARTSENDLSANIQPRSEMVPEIAEADEVSANGDQSMPIDQPVMSADHQPEISFDQFLEHPMGAGQNSERQLEASHDSRESEETSSSQSGLDAQSSVLDNSQQDHADTTTPSGTSNQKLDVMPIIENQPFGEEGSNAFERAETTTVSPIAYEDETEYPSSSSVSDSIASDHESSNTASSESDSTIKDREEVITTNTIGDLPVSDGAEPDAPPSEPNANPSDVAMIKTDGAIKRDKDDSVEEDSKTSTELSDDLNKPVETELNMPVEPASPIQSDSDSREIIHNAFSEDEKLSTNDIEIPKFTGETTEEAKSIKKEDQSLPEGRPVADVEKSIEQITSSNPPDSSESLKKIDTNAPVLVESEHGHSTSLDGSAETLKIAESGVVEETKILDHIDGSVVSSSVQDGEIASSKISETSNEPAPKPEDDEKVDTRQSKTEDSSTPVKGVADERTNAREVDASAVSESNIGKAKRIKRKSRKNKISKKDPAQNDDSKQPSIEEIREIRKKKRSKKTSATTEETDEKISDMTIKNSPADESEQSGKSSTSKRNKRRKNRKGKKGAKNSSIIEEKKEDSSKLRLSLKEQDKIEESIDFVEQPRELAPTSDNIPQLSEENINDKSSEDAIEADEPTPTTTMVPPSDTASKNGDNDDSDEESIAIPDKSRRRYSYLRNGKAFRSTSEVSDMLMKHLGKYDESPEVEDKPVVKAEPNNDKENVSPTSDEIKAELADMPLPPMLDDSNLIKSEERSYGSGKTNTNRNRITKLNHRMSIKDGDWTPERELISKEGGADFVRDDNSSIKKKKRVFQEKSLPLARKLTKNIDQVDQLLASSKRNNKIKSIAYKSSHKKMKVEER